MPRLHQTIDQIENVGDTIKISRFDGGLNTSDSNEILPDSAAIIRKNWGNEDVGAIQKVNGLTKSNAITIASKPIRGLFRVYLSAGTTESLAVCNGGLYYSDDDFATLTQEAGSVALTETEFCRGVNYNNLFFLTNKTDNLHVYTQSTHTLATATDQPTDACEVLLRRADRRLLALVNASNGSTLYYSKIDPTGAAADDWSATNDAGSIAIDGAKSQPLTGGATLGSVDIIFKDHAAYKVWGYPAPQVVKIDGAPGCAAPHSVSYGEGLLFWLSHDGVWMWDGTRFFKISRPIKSIIDTIDKDYIRNSFGVYRKGEYYLFYTTGTTNQNCIVYDVEHSNPYNNQNVWYERDEFSMNCPLVFSGKGDEHELYAGTSASTGFVYRLDYSTDGSDDSSSINAVYQTKYFNGGYPHLVKRFSKIHIRYYNSKGTITVRWRTNYGTTTDSYNVPISQAGTALGSFLLGTSVLVGSTEETQRQTLPDTAVGKDISLEFTHNDTATGGNAPIIRDVTIDWEALYEE